MVFEELEKIMATWKKESSLMPLGSLLGSDTIATPSPDLLGHSPLSSTLHPRKHQMAVFR